MALRKIKKKDEDCVKKSVKFHKKLKKYLQL